MELHEGEMVFVRRYSKLPEHWVENMAPLMGKLVVVSKVAKLSNNKIIKVKTLFGDRVIWNFHEDDFEKTTWKIKLSLNKATELLSMCLGADVEIEV